MIVDESNPFASVSAEIAFQLQLRCFDYLDAPSGRVTARDTPAPYAKNLMEDYLPDAERVYRACREALYLD